MAKRNDPKMGRNRKSGKGAWGKSVFLGLVMIALTGAAWAQQDKKMISIATGGTGGVYYPYGGGIANVISKYIPGVQATAEVTAASVDNCKLIDAGKAELGFMGADVAWDAYQGQLKGYSKKIPLRAVAVLYPNVTSLIVLDGKGIHQVSDLKGKRISTGAPNSGTEVKSTRILEAYGIHPDKDVKREKLSFVESVGALRDRKIDAVFVDGGLPLSAVMDLTAAPGVKVKFLDHGDAVPKMVAKYGPVYYVFEIPKGTYPAIDYRSKVVANANFLACHEKLDEKLIYHITRALFDYKPELVKVHKEAENLTLENAVKGSPVPFHPGAARYYGEKNLEVKTQ
jgi:TRAP transporter TAXI family solute receptor